MTDLTSWLEQTWAFELGFLQSADETDPNAFYPLSCPSCDPSFPKKNKTSKNLLLLSNNGRLTIAVSMFEIRTVTNKAEQTRTKLTRVSKPPPPTPPSLHNYDSHTRALAKAEKTLLTQDINIKHMNTLHVDLEDTVTCQREAITTLIGTVDQLDRLTKENSNLESRHKILGSLTAENVSQAPPDIVININSANQHTTSSLDSSHNDPGPSTRKHKRRKQTIPDQWSSRTTPRDTANHYLTYAPNSAPSRNATHQRPAYERPQPAPT